MVHNRYIISDDESVGEPDWETPNIIRIKTKKSKRFESIFEE
jgi:hypothetical protein